MKIEQKNTLLIISLVLAVLLGLAGSGFLLIRHQVTVRINEDLDRAQRVFLQAQENRFDNLLTVAGSVRDESRLMAATLTGDIAALRSTLGALHPRPGADFMAVYIDEGAAGVLADGDKRHYPSAQVLSSPVLTKLARSLRQGDLVAFGDALLYDSWLQLVALPLENLPGRRVGVLLVGKRFGQVDLQNLRRLVFADMAIFQGKRLLASSIRNLQTSAHLKDIPAASKAQGRLDIGNERYGIRILPALKQPSGKQASVKVLLAANYSTYWSPYKLLAQMALYFSAMMLPLVALFGIAMSRRFLTRPLQLLARATQDVAGGNMNIRVSVKRNDELGELGDSLNAMVRAIDSSRRELDRNRQRFRDFASSSSDWLWETDCSGHFTFVSSSVSKTLGMAPENWLGRTLAEVFPGSSLGELTRLLRPGDKERQSFKDVAVWVHSLNGAAHCLRLNGVPVFSKKKFKGYRGSARDITKLKRDEKHMLVLTNQDHLTGLSNRRRFLEELNHEVCRVERERQIGVLLLLDLDHLKLVNDTAGHSAGDQIIVQVAGLLKQASREQDLLARISGDEFAVAYSAMSEEQGLQKSRELLQSINSLKPRYGGRTLNISASVGVVTFPHQGKLPVELMAKADAAMSLAKSSGRNRVHRYDETDMMRERMDSQLVWKDRLLEALEQDALHLVFQPIVGVSSDKVHHYEVLVRMVEDNGALIAPGRFIPAAEQFGLIQRVDRQVVRKAIRRLAELPAEMLDVGFSINLSGLSVGRQDMYDLIEHEMREGDVDPARLTFEITETAACEQLNNAMEFIQKIRQLGCMVSLDDFGVGFSSFSYLKHLQADILKIDGSFIRDIHNNKADQLFVKALVDVARGMGMRTIAEFVENEQVFERVRGLGVDYVQGCYLGKPKSTLGPMDNVVGDGVSASVA